MSIAVVEESSEASGQLFAVEVLDSEARCCRLRARGALNARGAEMLEAVLTAQQKRGMRYVGLDVSAVRAAAPAGIAGLLNAHRRFLAGRGTLVLTGGQQPAAPRARRRRPGRRPPYRRAAPSPQ